MTLAQFAILFGVFTLGTMLGVVLLALFVGSRDNADDIISQAAAEQDAELMDYLEHSECNLFFNPTLAAWGLLDGQDKMIATARSVRTTLARAMVSDKAGA